MASFPSSSSSSPPIDDSSTLIPGLPNEIAAQILSFVPYSHHSRLKATSKAWRAFFSSKTLISFRHRQFRLTHLLCIFPHDDSIPSPYLFDPQNLAWRPLPPMPCKYQLSNFASVSIGPNLYVLGGSISVSRYFPISSSVFRFNFVDSTWDRLSPMLSPRESFACAAIPHLGQIIVAGGGSRHTLFDTEDNGMSSVDGYDIGRDEWMRMEGLSMIRTECEGLLVGNGEESEFWVVGGYVESDDDFDDDDDEFCTDALVLDVKGNEVGKWRKIGDVLQEGEGGPGKIVAVEDYGVFKLENGDIFRYDMASNFWEKESTVPRKAPFNSSYGFVELDGELHVMIPLIALDITEKQKSEQKKSVGTLLIQIYHPRKKTWRSLTTQPPFNRPLDFNKAVMCTIRL